MEVHIDNHQPCWHTYITFVGGSKLLLITCNEQATTGQVARGDLSNVNVRRGLVETRKETLQLVTLPVMMETTHPFVPNQYLSRRLSVMKLHLKVIEALASGQS